MRFQSYDEPGARYATLLMRAKLIEQKALTQLSEARNRIEFEQDKLQQLQSYATDRQPAEQVSLPSSLASTLANRHAFMCRLREAIHLQQQQISRLRQKAEHARQQWVTANGETRRYEQLIENERQRARQRANRREQKELDEIAQQAHHILHHRSRG